MYWVVVAVVIDGFVISANIIELMLLLKRWKRLDRIEHILFSLCVADLTCGIFMFGQDAYQLRLIVIKSVQNMSTTAAIVLDCMVVFFILVSHFHVSAIAVERIVAVSKPLKYSVFTTQKCKILTISLVWVLALLIAPALTLAQKYSSKGMAGQHVLASTIVAACILVFVSYMLLTYLLIKRDRVMKELAQPEQKKQLRDRQATLFCLLFGFAFLICMMPYAIGLFNAVDLFHPFQIILLTAYHFVNPIVYFVKYFFNGRARRNTITANSASRLLTRSPRTTRTTFVVHGDSMNSFRA